MRDVPDYFWKWTDIDWETGNRIVKSDAPADIVAKLTEYERSEYELTGRRCITNLEI